MTIREKIAILEAGVPVRLLESKLGAIARLQPNTKLSVFHGNSSQKEVYQMVLRGIDSLKPHARLYPHFSGGAPKWHGLYVAPDLPTAKGFAGFGGAVIKFKALGRELFYYFPLEQDAEDRIQRAKFPKSFRPSVSAAMQPGAYEPQALFRGFVPRRRIEAVYVVTDSTTRRLQRMNPDDFLAYFDENKDKLGAAGEYFHEPLFQPNEVPKASYEELLKRLRDIHGVDRVSAERGLATVMSRVAGRTFEEQLYALMDAYGQDSIPHSVALALLPKVLKKFHIPLGQIAGERRTAAAM